MAELRWLDAADEDGWAELAGLFTDYCREAIPADPPVSGDEWRSRARHVPAHARTHHVMAVEGDRAVAAAAFGMNTLRPKSAWLMFLFVAPEHRRRGIGSCLFDTVRDTARAAGRDRIRTSTVVGHAAGAAFATRAGARPGLVNEVNRCPTAALDVEQLRGWRDRAVERAAAYSLVAFDGVCPEEHLDAFVAAIPIMNTAPRMDGTEDVVPSRQEVRENMQAFADDGASWTVCARHDGTGQFVGYTELFFPVHRPWLAAQGDTGVHPDHRERGIGRWLKAHNALRLLAERPDVQFIETYNASGNAAMLSINRAMGFEVVARRQEWDVPV
ncbi:MAG: GNAT family N-acetyltransferase [Acidimicrobiales bacterium]